MSIAQILLPEFDHEMAGTRPMLEAVPAADAAWKPHPKSMALGELAAHLAALPLWGRMTMERTELDVGDPANASIARAPAWRGRRSPRAPTCSSASIAT